MHALPLFLPLLLAVLSAPQIAALPEPAAALSITLDGGAEGLSYDGHGALSAGASSRLLFDYPALERDQILDFLFRPNFGASLHMLKVEIGGDTQSTDGTEPSHQHTREDLNCERGYEFWLLEEAKRRNPNILTYALAWGCPGWVGNQSGYYSDDQIQYQISFLRCARDAHHVDIDYLGLWNERPWGNVGYVKALRAALDGAGFGSTRLALLDGCCVPDDFMKSLATDAAFARAVDVVGLHYPCNQPHPAIVNDFHKKFWASEDWWSKADWPGAQCWARLFHSNFIRMNMTATIAWSLIWSVYPQVDVFEGDGWGPGLMYAWQPWAGAYTVNPTVWASAHTTQFTQVGWRMLAVSTTGSGLLPAGGTYVTYVSNASDALGALDFALVLETASAPGCAHCSFVPQEVRPQTLVVALRGGLERHAALAVWMSNASVQFVQLPDVPVQAGSFQLTLQPDAIYTVASTRGQAKGSAAPPPPPAPFPAAYADDFESTPAEQEGRFWADQCGSWQVVEEGAGSANHVLRQRVTQLPGVNQWTVNAPVPITVLGDTTWRDTDTAVRVRLLGAAAAAQRRHDGVLDGVLDGSCPSVAICARVSYIGQGIYPQGVCLNVSASGQWQLLENTAVLAAGSVALDPHAWVALNLTLAGTHVTAAIDQQRVVQTTASGARGGMVALCSSWDLVDFDDFAVQATNSTPPRPPPGSLVVDVQDVGRARTDYTGLSGMLVEMAAAASVVALGRLAVPGNTLTHVVALYDAATQQLLGRAAVDTRGPQDALGFVYASLPAAVAVQAGQQLFVVADEQSDGDAFFDIDGTVLSSNATLGRVLGGCYKCAPPEAGCSGGWQTMPAAGSAYGPVNLLVTV